MVPFHSSFGGRRIHGYENVGFGQACEEERDSEGVLLLVHLGKGYGVVDTLLSRFVLERKERVHSGTS